MNIYTEVCDNRIYHKGKYNEDSGTTISCKFPVHYEAVAGVRHESLCNICIIPATAINIRNLEQWTNG